MNSTSLEKLRAPSLVSATLEIKYATQYPSCGAMMELCGERTQRRGCEFESGRCHKNAMPARVTMKTPLVKKATGYLLISQFPLK